MPLRSLASLQGTRRGPAIALPIRAFAARGGVTLEDQTSRRRARHRALHAFYRAETVGRRQLRLGARGRRPLPTDAGSRPRPPAKYGDELTLRFAVWDGEDGLFDTTVLVDGFAWIPYVKPGPEGPPPAGD